MLKSDIPNHDFPWEGGALFHNHVADKYFVVRFGNGTNDPNDDEDVEAEADPFDDYLICEVYDGGELRRNGIDLATSEDGCMIPIHRRDRASGQIRDWVDKGFDVMEFDYLNSNFVSLVE